MVWHSELATSPWLSTETVQLPHSQGNQQNKVVLFANTDWYLYNFRRSLAVAARDAGYEVVLVSPDGPYGPKLEKMGFRWLAVPMDRRSLNPVRETRLIGHLAGLFRRERADLVHGFTIKCAVYGSLAARLAGVRCRVNAVAGMGYVFTSEEWKARLLRPVVRHALRAALGGNGAQLILQNPDDVDLFVRTRLVAKDKIRLIQGSGVDCDRFRPPHGARADRPFTVLLASRLLWDKGVADYVQAAREIRQQNRAVRFLLAGMPDPGNPASVPINMVGAWGAEGLIEWLGQVEDMPTLLSDVDVVVLPSYREGLPRTLIEAAACGLPSIGTDVPGCRHVIVHEHTGMLVPPRDPLELARAIALLQDEPVLAERLGRAARQRALAQFDDRRINQQTLAVYRELLNAEQN